MIRTTITPHSKTVLIHIPSDYIGKELEITAFEKGEGLKSDKKAKKKCLFLHYL